MSATGYTYPVIEGKVTELREFVWDCARAFGALVLMRDDPKNAIVPEFEPSTYARDARLKDEADLKRILAMTDEERDAEAEKDRVAEADRRLKSNAESAANRQRCRDMLAKVEAWLPPTPGHENLKKFMVEQLETTIDGNADLYTDPPAVVSGAEWRAQRIENLRRSIGYYAKADAEEVARTAERNVWVKALRESVGEQPRR